MFFTVKGTAVELLQRRTGLLLVKRIFNCTKITMLYEALSLPKFRNGDKCCRNFLGKFPESPELVEFHKSEPFTRKFQVIYEECQIESKFPVRNFLYPARLSSFPEIPENALPSITRNFLKLKPESFIEWKAPII